MSRSRGLTASLRHYDYRCFIAAFTCAGVGAWAYNVALAVWIFDATGSLGWITAAAVVRWVPAMLLGTYAGVVADRFDKVTVMRTVDLVCAAAMAALATLMFLDAPVLAVVAVTAVASSVYTFYEPAAAGLTPLIVPERDLASANALRNTIDNVTVIGGPLVGAVFLAVAGSGGAVLLNAGTCLASAGFLVALRTRSPRIDVTDGGSAGPLQQMLVGIRAMGSSTSTAVMVGFSILATFAYGVDTVLFIAASDDKLGTGPDGYGYLLAGLGLGGVLAAPIVARAESSPSLAPIIVGGMALYCLPTLVFLTTGSPEVAFAAQVVRGAGTMFVDVLAETAMQRTLPNDVISRVFGAFNTLMILVILLGSGLTSLSIAVLGLDTTIWLAGAGVFALSLLGLPSLVAIDRVARVGRALLQPRIELLEACDLFEQVDDGDLTQLAATGQSVQVAPGDVVVAEGDPADAFYVVVSGRLAVSSSSAGAPIPDLTDGTYLGEIGLVEGRPRTATVVAVEDTRLLRFPGDAFQEALTAFKPSVAMLEGSAVRMRRTHTATGSTRGAVVS